MRYFYEWVRKAPHETWNITLASDLCRRLESLLLDEELSKRRYELDLGRFCVVLHERCSDSIHSALTSGAEAQESDDIHSTSDVQTKVCLDGLAVSCIVSAIKLVCLTI